MHDVLWQSEPSLGDLSCAKRNICTALLLRVQTAPQKEKLQLSDSEAISEPLLGTLGSYRRILLSRPFPSLSESEWIMTASESFRDRQSSLGAMQECCRGLQVKSTRLQSNPKHRAPGHSACTTGLSGVLHPLCCVFWRDSAAVWIRREHRWRLGSARSILSLRMVTGLVRD